MTYDREQYRRIKLGLEKKTTGAKPKKPIKKVSDKRKVELAEEKEQLALVNAARPIGVFHGKQDEKEEVNQWFDYFMEVSEPVCAECGFRADWLKSPGYEKIWRACQAHILPKKKNYGFPSLASNRDNHIVLFPSWGGHLCGCHGFYDSNWYNATTMKIWPRVVGVFLTKLHPIVPPKENKNIPEVLLALLK
jgi:hypothetical protein